MWKRKQENVKRYQKTSKLMRKAEVNDEGRRLEIRKGEERRRRRRRRRREEEL
jgi:hypothetical protein